MTILIALVAIAAFVVLGSLYFVTAPPSQIALLMRYSGPAVLALAGVIVGLTGRVAAGVPILLAAAGWLMRQRRAAGVQQSRGRKSTVRSVWLEMELDHDTGAMDGLVLAGTHEGETLNAMSEADLKKLAADLKDDRESAELLEAYLDRRMPGWRDDVDADAGPRHAGPHDTGAMSHEEAYKVLGLEPGASAVEIRKAHRRLMQRVHPDLGGNAFLAQRVNEARDCLLRDHAK